MPNKCLWPALLQLKWRLREGNGEAIYEIGVQDSGILTGLSKRDMTASLQTLKQMALKLGATTSLLQERILENKRIVTEVLVRKIPDDQNNIEIRVAVLGNAGEPCCSATDNKCSMQCFQMRGKAPCWVY